MGQSIPASQLVSSIPGVLGPGGNPLSFNAVFLTTDPSIPIGVAQAFGSADAVEKWFGPNAQETMDAEVYFNGFTLGTLLPTNLYFYQYNTGVVAGYLRGGALTGVTLTALQALSGTITILIDGVSHVSDAINLSATTSFSDAASLIQTGLQGGTPSTTATVTFDSLRNAFVITSATTGASSSVGFATADSLTTGLLLTASTGAVQSAGAIAATPSGALNGVVQSTQNWVSLHLVFDPDSGSPGGAQKLLFSKWISQNSPAGVERFVYAAWDSDLTPGSNGADSACFAAALIAAEYNGTVPIYDQTNGLKAAFFCGMVASTNYDTPNGAIAYDGKGQAGLTTDVNDGQTALNLIANGYNFYGSYTTANQTFNQFQTGSMPGEWVWADPYVNQIWLNNMFQLALMTFKQQSNKVPYNTIGYGGIRAAMFPIIVQALANGVIEQGVNLSGSQIQQINSATNNPNAGNTVGNIGWYLFIGVASPTTRNTRGSPPILFYYTDGGSIRTITINSIDVE